MMTKTDVIAALENVEQKREQLRMAEQNLRSTISSYIGTGTQGRSSGNVWTYDIPPFRTIKTGD